MISKNTILPLVLVAAAIAQEQPVQPGLRTPDQPTANSVALEPGTKIPLTLLNTLSSKQTAEGDRVYLETLYPVLLQRQNRRAARQLCKWYRHRGQATRSREGPRRALSPLQLLTLPNGVTREFRARIGGMEGGGNNQLDREEGKIKGGGSKGDDARTIGQAAEMGTMVGGIAGAAGGRPMTGVLGGAGAGAAAGLAGVLLTRGPDIVLQKGSVVEMVLDRTLSYEEKELDFSTAPQRSTRTVIVPAGDDSRTQKRSNWPLPF